jgi:tetratricopeptide (TPR) repeat protein
MIKAAMWETTPLRHGFTVLARASLCLLGSLAIMVPFASFAADPVQIDQLVSAAKNACLVGTQYDLSLDRGDLLSFSRNSGGIRNTTTIQMRSSIGATSIIDQNLRVRGDEDIRACMKPYVDRIFAVSIGDISHSGRLELVDVSFVKYEGKDHPLFGFRLPNHGEATAINEDVLDDSRFSSSFPVLEIKIRNTGEVASIKEAVFDVKHVWEVRSSWQPANDCATWNYDVMLPVLGNPNPVKIKLSQKVRSGDTDRLTFTIGNDAPPKTLSKFAFLVDVTLIYDGDNKTLKLPQLFFLSDSKKANAALTNAGSWDDAALHNMQIIDELGGFAGIMNEDARKFYYTFSSDIIPDYVKDLESSLTYRRTRAAHWLALFGWRAQTALPLLQQLAMMDPEPEVREAANSAAGSIEAAMNHRTALPNNDAGQPLRVDLTPDEILKPEDFCADKGLRSHPTIAPSPPIMNLALGWLDKVLGALIHEWNALKDYLLMSHVDYIARAEEEFDNGDYHAAVVDATKAMQYDDKDDVRFIRGKAYLELGQYGKAIEDLSIEIKRHEEMSFGTISGYPPIRVARARAYQGLGMMDRAEEDFDVAATEKVRVIEQRAKAGTFFYRGQFRLDRGDFQGAIADLRKAVAIDPEYIGFYAELGEGLVVAGRYDEVPLVVRQIRELGSTQSDNIYLSFALLFLAISNACRGQDIETIRSEFVDSLQTYKKTSWSFRELDGWLEHGNCDSSSKRVAARLINALKTREEQR